MTQGEGLIYVGGGTSHQLFFSHRSYVAVSCYAMLLKMEIRYQKSNSVFCGGVTLLKNSDLNNSIIYIIDTSPSALIKQSLFWKDVVFANSASGSPLESASSHPTPERFY